MNRFAGIIKYGVNRGSADNNYFQNLSGNFPSAFPGSVIYSSPFISLLGNFELASNEKQQLFFSGEIYNGAGIASLIHNPLSQFRDNAALVNALITEKGLEAVKNINGQFVIIYFDRQLQKVFILCDHLAVQQIFYHQSNNIFLFASEIKFLLSHPGCPKEIDWETSLKQPLGFPGLASYQNYKTWFKDITLLPGATMLEIDLSTANTKETKYWAGLSNPDHNCENDNRTAVQVMEEYISLLDDAVRITIAGKRKASSLLSGGLDSSVICALAANYKPLETFSIITQMTCLEDTTTYCNRLSKDLGFKNTQFLVPYHELAFNPQLWKQSIWRAESPLNHIDSVTKTMLHYCIRKKDPHIKHLLSGTGSDQFNGGLVRWVVNDGETKEESWEKFYEEIKDAENRRLISRGDDALWNKRKFIHRDFLSSISGNPIENNPWMFYVNSALHDISYGLLWDETRASSSNGHNTRFPFMDFRFAEFISKIPPHLHKELFYDKPILREPAKKLLPDYIINKQKAPYFFPEYAFDFRLFNFLTSNNDFINEALGDPDERHPVINKKVLLSRIEHLRKEPEIMEWEYIMRIINLCLLEKLPGKNESDLDYESALEAPMEIAFDNPATTKIFLEKRLGIKDTEELLDCTLQFENGCSLVFDKLNNKYFLAKNNTLAYEIEDEYKDWKTFLVNIDNIKTANQILEEHHIMFETIEEFFRLALKEQIFVTKGNDQQI